MDINKLVENYFNNEDEPLSKKNLWEMFDVAYGDLSKLKGKYSIIQEEEEKIKKSAGEQFVLSLPKFTPSDAWGKPNSAARESIEGYLKQIQGGRDIQARLKWLERLSGDVPEKGREITSPRRVISTLILLESLSACFNSFNDSSAGFIFEGFLAAILGGHQETGKKSAGGALPIQDIFAFSTYGDDDPGIPISLKALKRTTIIKGSYKNLVDALHEFKEGMKYIIAYKDSAGEEVTAIDIAEFTINRQNFLDILKVNLAGQSLMTLPDKSWEESYNTLKSIDDWDTLYGQLQQTNGYARKTKDKQADEEDEVETQEEESPKKLTTAERHAKAREEALQMAADKGWDKHFKPKAEKETIKLTPAEQRRAKVKAWGDARAAQLRKKEETQETLNEAAAGGTQWNISPAQLRTLSGAADTPGENSVSWKKLAVLEFSEENLYKTAERYTEVLNDSIRDLFQATSELSKNINAYFSTTERGEAIEKGNDAVENTITIEKEMSAQTTATETNPEL